MNKFFTIFILLVLAICCNSVQSQSYILRGRVVKPDFIPVHNITVFVGDYESSDKTSANGEFKIVMPKEIDNPQVVKIKSEEGFEYKRHNYRPKESLPLEIIIDLPDRALKGRVVYRNGRGVINGSISIKEVALKDSIYTDKLGYFSVMLPEGYSVSTVYNSNALIINGRAVKKESTRMMSANFIQVRLSEDRPSTLYTVAVYDSRKFLVEGARIKIDGVRYNLDKQGYVKINNPNLRKGVFEVEGYKMIGTPQFIDDDNLVEIYVEKMPPPANGIIKEKEKELSKTNSTQEIKIAPRDSLKSKYEGEISSLSANIENSRKDFENNNKKLADKLEELSEKLSSDVNITPTQISGLKNQLGDLEKTLAENDASYERSKLQTQNLLNRLKEAILQKDSIGRELLAAEKLRKELEQEKKKIQIERKKEEEDFKTKLWGVSSVSVMLTFLLLVVYFFSARIRKQKKELVEKVQEIEHKNSQLRITLDELKKAQAQLVSSEKMASLGQLTAGIAHEINNPVNFTYAGAISLKRDFDDLTQLLEQYRQISIGNVATVLPLAHKVEKDLDYPEIRREIDELLVSIKRGAERTAEIVKSLRTFARLDEDTLKKVDIEENIDATLVMLHSQYKDRIEIVKQYGKIPPVECFPGQMNQVFMNILMNAVQAIEGKGTIFISTAYPSSHGSTKYANAVEISIRDTGIGMTEEVKDNIFEPFFTTKDVGSGSGLGLSVSFGILEKHKGEIKVFSELGKGSEFVIILPLTSLQASSSTTTNESLANKNSSNKVVS